jgi:hypothetical protein
VITAGNSTIADRKPLKRTTVTSADAAERRALIEFLKNYK